MDAADFYDVLGEDYDLMVSWEERLAREERFFRGLFSERGVRRVLDAACGTGMHAVRFAQWGLTVSAADLSPTMVERARANAEAAGAAVDVRVAPFGALGRAFDGPLDAITCLGNSVPHLLDGESLHKALTDMAGLLKPGGVLVIQNRNYDRVLRDKLRFMPPVARERPDGETLFLRMTDFLGGEALEFSILTLRKKAGAWDLSVKSTPLRAVTRDGLLRELHDAGFSDIGVYGSYQGAAFDPPGSPDLVVVAERLPA